MGCDAAARTQAAMKIDAAINVKNPITAGLSIYSAQQFLVIPSIISPSHYSKLSPFFTSF